MAVGPANPTVVDIMLVAKDATFNFRNAIWSRLTQNFPTYAALLGAGSADDASAADRYSQLMENSAATCWLVSSTWSRPCRRFNCPVKTPLDYIKELIWDDTMAQDRFFAWADPAVIDQVIQATSHGQFAPGSGHGRCSTREPHAVGSRFSSAKPTSS